MSQKLQQMRLQLSYLERSVLACRKELGLGSELTEAVGVVGTEAIRQSELKLTSHQFFPSTHLFNTPTIQRPFSKEKTLRRKENHNQDCAAQVRLVRIPNGVRMLVTAELVIPSRSLAVMIL